MKTVVCPLLFAVDVNGLRTLMTYDMFGQILRTQFHGTTDSVQLGPDKTFSLSWCNNLCDPGPQSLYTAREIQDGTPGSTIAYDKLGRNILVSHRGLGGTYPRTMTQFNARGLVAAQSEPYWGEPAPSFWTTFQYDALGRVTQKIVPKGADDGRGDLRTTYTYSGLQTAIQVCGTADVGTINCLNLNRTTDSMGRYMETVDAKGGITQFWIDAGGHTLALVDAKGSVTRAVYNGSGQRMSVTDPNQGTWSFAYDALGELLQQTDARNVVTTSRFDKLGRPISRTVSIDVTGDNVPDAIVDSWTYDPLNGVGKPASSQRTVNGAIERQQIFGYDTLARPIQTDTTQQIATGQTKAYTQTLAYDTYYGRPKSTGYPNGEAVGTYYDKYGHPIRSFNPANGAVYREITAMNMYGSPTVASLGGGLLTDTRTYRPSTNELTTIATTKSGTALRQLDYQSDVFGNETRQTLNSGATVENYSYDTLQRMTQATRTGAVSSTINYSYDAAGNFTSKSDFSTTAINAYTYTGGGCGGGPNAVKSVVTPGGTRNYCYDADGNLTSDSAGLQVKYDHDNLAFQTTRGASTIYLAYGPDNQRTRQWGSDGTKVYMDGYEDWISAGSSKVYVGGDAVITTAGATRTVNYLLTDRLGSEDAIADAAGNLIETRGSDSFGKPRSGTWADLSPARLQSTAITEHGFTGHEHLNSVELIHMNGRVYDYALGRFLSVDPFIQFPLNSQSLNPYSYILNNPLSGTDPTGYTACILGELCVEGGETNYQQIGGRYQQIGDRPYLRFLLDAKSNGGNKTHQGSSTPKAVPDKQPLPLINRDAWNEVNGVTTAGDSAEAAQDYRQRDVEIARSQANQQRAVSIGNNLNGAAMEGVHQATLFVALGPVGEVASEFKVVKAGAKLLEDTVAAVRGTETATIRGSEGGLGASDAAHRYSGPWTERDLTRAAEGKGPLDMVPMRDVNGREMPLQLHHGDQMPGAAIHEVDSATHHGRDLHGRPSQGVTREMRRVETQLHWQLRGQEMGNSPPGR